MDTTILIWGHRKQGTQNELDRARWLLESFNSDESIIVISTPVLAEYLTPAEPRDHAAIIAALNTRFTLTLFDVRAASIAATLFKAGLESADRGYQNWRQVLRADCAVVAGAKAARVQDFYSNDPQCLKFAKAVGMEPCSLPTIPNDLYDESYKRNPPR